MDLVKWLRVHATGDDFSDDLMEQAANEIERLREALRNAYEVYAGSEGIPSPITASEAYLVYLLNEMVHIINDALKEGE